LITTRSRGFISNRSLVNGYGQVGRWSQKNPQQWSLSRTHRYTTRDGVLAAKYPTNREQKLAELSAFQPGAPDEATAVAASLWSREAAFFKGEAYGIDGGATALR
jgi:hypothetical protein